MSLTVHSTRTASEKARQLLLEAEKAYRFVPNVLGVMANAPALLEAYLALGRIFEKTTFTPTERQVVMMTVNALHQCTYCMAAHTVIAGMQNVPDDVITALREGRAIDDPRLEALRRFTAAVVTTRGWPHEADKRAFLEAGYSEAQMLEVVLGTGFKLLSNYANHLAETPLDPAFEHAAWPLPA